MRRATARLLLGAAGAFVATAAGALAGDATREEAKTLAGRDLAPIAAKYCAVAASPAPEIDLPAVRAFDNIVMLGRAKWDSWALLTSKGIILFDSLETNAEAQRYIIEGLKSAGLDPTTIRYVVVMHGHGDHFGGAKLIHDRFGARVMMSDADWKLVAATAAAGKLHPDQPAPDRDLTITDGMALTLGDTTVRLYLTPGHTPGTASALIPLRDGQKKYLAGYWGGSGFGKTEPLDVYRASIAKWEKITRAAGVDVALSNHPTNDLTLARLPELLARKPGEPNPLVIGRATYQRVMRVIDLCVRAAQEDRK